MERKNVTAILTTCLQRYLLNDVIYARRLKIVLFLYHSVTGTSSQAQRLPIKIVQVRVLDRGLNHREFAKSERTFIISRKLASVYVCHLMS